MVLPHRGDRYASNCFLCLPFAFYPIKYLAIDSGGHVSDLVLARNCCLARMLPREAENGVGMNRSVRDGKMCEAL